MSIFLHKYQRLLTSLRRAPTKYGIAPHKPVLLLSLIDRMEELSLTLNQILVDLHLFELFRKNWKALVRTGNKMDITLPLYHLSDGLGWHLTDKHENQIDYKLSSQEKILKEVRFGSFDRDFFQFLQIKDNRDIARTILLDAYFPDTKFNYLKDLQLPSYFQEIEQSVWEEGTAVYRSYDKKVEGFVRDWKFRAAVMQVYQHTCCMSGLHLEPDFSLIQACHIIPHTHSGNDHITNGISLCANLHLAFDNGLISLNDNYEVLILPKIIENDSPYSIHQLKGKQIKLPSSEKHYPRPEYLHWHRKKHGFSRK